MYLMPSSNLTELSDSVSEIGAFTTDLQADTTYTAANKLLVIVGFASLADNSAVIINVNPGLSNNRNYSGQSALGNRLHQVIGFVDEGETFKIEKGYGTSSTIMYIQTIQVI